MLSVRDKIVQAFQAIHIHDVREDCRLGDELGMDSQELVSLTCELEQRFAITIPDEHIQRSTTVAQLVDVVGRQLAPAVGDGTANTEAFTGAPLQGSLSEELVINAPLGIVYGCLHDVREWPRLLPHVEAIEVIYDDNRYQEFYMTVCTADGGQVRVRSIRKCSEAEITFFQPDPPKFLSRHSGAWTFTEGSWNRCLVRTRHEWKLNDEARRLYPPKDGLSPAARVESLLREHARLALTSWKSIIEEGRQYGTGTSTHPGAVTARI